MRPRKKKYTEKRLAACAEYLFELPEEETPVLYEEIFGGEINCPIRMEIGCGKGSFICETARREPDVCFLAVEREREVAVMAVEKAAAMGLHNVRFVLSFGEQLLPRLPEGRLDRLYLNFSDPWPKARHAKRRLTHPRFLAMYERVMSPGAELWMKTDNRGLFAYSLETVPSVLTVQSATHDLANSEWDAENVQTEYEAAFRGKGIQICRMTAKKG